MHQLEWANISHELLLYFDWFKIVTMKMMVFNWPRINTPVTHPSTHAQHQWKHIWIFSWISHHWASVFQQWKHIWITLWLLEQDISCLSSVINVRRLEWLVLGYMHFPGIRPSLRVRVYLSIVNAYLWHFPILSTWLLANDFYEPLLMLVYECAVYLWSNSLFSLHAGEHYEVIELLAPHVVSTMLTRKARFSTCELWSTILMSWHRKMA